MKSKKLCTLALFFLLFIASAANSGTIDCYVGTQKVSSIAAENFNGKVCVSLPEIAKTLEFDMQKSGDEIVLSNGGVRLRVIERSIAAWVGNSLISLYDAPIESNGVIWLDERSANALFRGIYGGKKQVSFRDAVGVDSVQYASKTEKSPEQILLNSPRIRDEKPATISTPKPDIPPQVQQPQPQTQEQPQVQKQPNNKEQPSVNEIRWSRNKDRVRAVLVCDGEKDPVFRKDKENTTIMMSSANFDELDISSVYPDQVQTKDDSGTLVFYGKWTKIDVTMLKNPKRVVLDFFIDPKAPAPEPQKDEPAAEINVAANGPAETNIVVIDPGHGGQDPGAVANGVREKDVNLAIGLKLESVLKAKGIRTEMTRRTDVYLTLGARTEIANKLNAAVFVSVHANAMPKGKKAAGFEIYIMALPTDRDALELAKFENRELVNGKLNTAASDQNTQKFVQKLSREDKKKVSLILGDMKQNDKITRSTRLTESLFSSGNKSGLPMRRVAQAPFFVLRATDNVTSVLLETGFLTDAREAKLLAHPGYQQKIADAMASGIISYIRGGK